MVKSIRARRFKEVFCGGFPLENAEKYKKM